VWGIDGEREGGGRQSGREGGREAAHPNTMFISKGGTVAKTNERVTPPFASVYS